MKDTTVTRLHPAPCEELPLSGLYLHHALHRSGSRRQPLVYTNFVSSLDGRIAIEQPDSGAHEVPASIANSRDWRLYQELVAQADILIVSARYLRQLAEDQAQAAIPLSEEPAFDDLHAWRTEQGLPSQPALAVLSGSLDLPLQILREACDTRPVYVATVDRPDSAAVDRIGGTGANVLQVSGGGERVDGRRLIDALAAEGFQSIYSIAGPGVLETLINARVLDRLYLTHVHRLLGGVSFDTLLEGHLDDPPAGFRLNALYYDRGGDGDAGQLFGVYDAAP